MVKATQKQTTKSTKKSHVKFYIDLSLVLADSVIEMDSFDKYLRDHIKVDGRVGQLGNRVRLRKEKDSLAVIAEEPFSKRYLKYLTKRYLKKQELRDYLRIIATDKNTYQIKFLNLDQEEEQEE